MSQRNGDKSRFHRIRKKTIVRRERQRILLAGQDRKADGRGKASPGNRLAKSESSPPTSA
jgi:hypothetical protein